MLQSSERMKTVNKEKTVAEKFRNSFFMIFRHESVNFFHEVSTDNGIFLCSAPDIMVINGIAPRIFSLSIPELDPEQFCRTIFQIDFDP